MYVYMYEIKRYGIEMWNRDTSKKSIKSMRLLEIV